MGEARSLAGLALLLTASCSFSPGVGLSYAVKRDEGLALVPQISTRFSALTSRGIHMGFDLQPIFIPLTGNRSKEIRVALFVGWGVPPARTASRLGFEGGLLPALRFALNDGTPRLLASARIGVPVRFSDSKPHWNDDDIVDIFHVIVPELGFTYLFPECDRPWGFEFSGFLSYRVQFISSLMP